MSARLVLLYIVAVLAMLLASTSASARVEPQTRVTAFDVMRASCTELEASRTLEHRRANRVERAENASGSCVAAEGGVGLRVASGGGPSAPASVVRPIAHGEKVASIIEEGKALTYATGNEHAVVSLTNGQRVLVSGGPGGISFEGLAVRRLLGHTHPYELPPTGPSGADFGALESLGQRSSWLFEHGMMTRFRVGSP